MNWLMIVQFLVLTTVVSGVLIFFLKKALFDSTQGAVNRLNRETEEVRAKQSELNEKIKLANEELEREKEADLLVQKMTAQAEEKAKEEREKIMVKARQEGEEVIAKAIRTKDDIRKVIEKEMSLKAIDYTQKILTKVLSDKVKGVLDDKLITEFLDGLEKVDMGVIGKEVDTVEITTAAELGDTFKKRLVDIIKKRLNREIKIDAHVEPQIISGMVLRFGSLALDGSFKNIIQETSIAMKEATEKGLDF